MLVTVLDTEEHAQERKGHKGPHSELTPHLLHEPAPRKRIMQEKWWSKAQRQEVVSDL